MTSIYAVGLLGMLAFTYATLLRRAEGIVRDRLAHSATQVAAVVQGELARREAALRDPTITALPDSLMLDALLSRGVLRAELRDARGDVVLAAGSSAAVPPPDRDSMTSTRLVSRLHVVDGRAVFWMSIPRAERRQSIAALHPVNGPADADARLRQFIRDSIALHVRNADGSVWSRADGAVDAARRGPSSESQISGEAAVGGTPWLVSIETPRAAIASRQRGTLRILMWSSALLLLLGIVLSWMWSRRLTKPLLALTSATQTVASDGPPLAPGAKRLDGDEIGRLSSAFAAMSRRVEAAQQELERRATEAQADSEILEAMNQQLRATAAQAEKAQRDAETANKAKADFLAMMSHELRTPLNAIGGYAELLRMGIHGPLTDAQRDALDRMKRSQTHLLALINDVLSFARIDAGQVQFDITDVPLDEVLAGLEAMVAPQLRQKNLSFDVAAGSGVLVRADREKLLQIMLNLISNAIKYTPDGGSVSVSAGADAVHARVLVRDTGRGIVAERLPHIFEPFVQGGRALNRPDEGVGLGLAISRDLAHGMGGEILVQSQDGAGSTFTVVLKRAV